MVTESYPPSVGVKAFPLPRDW